MAFSRRLAASLALCAMSALGVSRPSETIVDLATGEGKIRGFFEDGYVKFRGVPFAEPPVGDLRWRLPQARKPWKPAIRNATEFAPVCMQQYPPCWYSIRGTRNSAEDCLYLDVYTPKGYSQGPPKPIMLWIHGGDYQYGGTNDRENANPPMRSVVSGGVVYVVINYRLGVFGYLGSEELRSRTADGSTGNFGTSDQRAAIAWIKANAKVFGGDPDRITIYGESAGAGSVTVQLVSEPSFGLFKNAITESGGFSQWVAKPMSHAQDQYNFYMKTLGLNASDVKGLMKKSSKDVYDATQYWNRGIPWPDTMVQCQFAPVIDGVQLKEHPVQLLQTGRIPKGVNVIFGSNRDEGTEFVSDNSYSQKHGHYSGADLPRGINESQFLDFSMGSWGASVGRALVDQDVYPLKCNKPSLAYDQCPEGTYNTYWWAATRATGDFMMTCTARRAARYWADATQGKSFAGNYYFAHTPLYSVNMNVDIRWGAFHGSEVPFVFYDTFELTGVAEQKLSKAMVQYWANFAATGDPNRGGFLSGKKPATWPQITSNKSTGAIRFATKRWKAYTSDFDQVNITGDQNTRSAECDFWDSINELVVYPIAKKNTAVAAPSTVDPSNMPPATTAGVWRTAGLPPMPTPRALFGVAEKDGVIYCMGGLATRENKQGKVSKFIDVDTTDVFDTATAKWSNGPALGVARSGLAAVTVGTTVFAIGGTRGIPQNRNNLGAVRAVEALDLSPGANAKWQRVASLPAARAHLAAAAFSNKIYAVGGWGEQNQDSLFIYDVSTDIWKKGPAMPTPRGHASAAVLSGRVVVAGGMSGFHGGDTSGFGADPLPIAEAFNPKTGTWSTLSNTPTARHSGAVVAVKAGPAKAAKTAILSLGGYGRGDSGAAEMLPSLSSANWTTLPDMPTRRMMGGAAAVENCVYAIGGVSISAGARSKWPFIGTVERLCVGQRE